MQSAQIENAFVVRFSGRKETVNDISFLSTVRCKRRDGCLDFSVLAPPAKFHHAVVRKFESSYTLPIARVLNSFETSKFLQLRRCNLYEMSTARFTNDFWQRRSIADQIRKREMPGGYRGNGNFASRNSPRFVRPHPATVLLSTPVGANMRRNDWRVNI